MNPAGDEGRIITFDSAITGGTGEYEKARGSVHSETLFTTPKVVRRFTIHLV
ncbi:hypothetical protein ACFW6V_22995 [Streptomyces sp. NPDC058734]|uniref:hypothetical protein n=1 Tax=Streptomyces sp. NPDC058734 TaxID=3346615 RepID=UPI0036CFF516